MLIRSGRSTLVCLVFLCCALAAQALTVTQQGNQLLVDGTPTAITFARGCTDPAWVPAYRALGFNTLLIRVDSPGERALVQAQALAAAADQAGLYVMIELANGSWSANEIASLTDDKYHDAVTYYLDGIVPTLRDCPRLLGWVIATVDESVLAAQLNAFSSFLKQKYGTLTALNAAWSVTTPTGNTLRSSITSFSILTIDTAPKLCLQKDGVQQVVQDDIAAYQARIAARDDEWRAYVQTRFENIGTYNGYFKAKATDVSAITYAEAVTSTKAAPLAGRAALELATYQARVPRVMFDWWATALRERDPQHLIFAGAQYQYRTMATLSPAINGIYTECYPGMAEPDPDSQNPHAYDIARRGNRFIVLAGVTAHHISPTQYANALYEAALHGATGIGVADWSGVMTSPDITDTTRAALADMDARRLLGQTPAPTVAFVYTPFGPGLYGADHKPLYGYMSGLFHPGVGPLYFTLRHGTAFGQIDYLAPEDLPVLPLARYHAIVLTTAYDVPEAAQTALANFVTNGGTVLMDMGTGAMQATGNLDFLPPTLRQLTNTQNTAGIRQVHLNLVGDGGHARFPSLPGRGLITGNDNGFLIAWSGQATPLSGTDILFASTDGRDRTRARTGGAARKPAERVPTRALFITAQDQGHVLYAPFPLYHHWTAVHPLFTEFHQDLFGAWATVQLQRPSSFLPAYAEIAHYTDGSAQVWTKDTSTAVISLRNPDRHCYDADDGSCAISPEGTTIQFATAGFKRVTPLPITVADVPFTVNFAVMQSTSQALVFELGADDDHAAAPVTLQIGDGRYPVALGSTHTVTIITQDGGTTIPVAADAQGILTLNLPQVRCRVMITNGEALIDVSQR